MTTADRAEHQAAWHRLARDIAARRGTISEEPPPVLPSAQGELIVIGSGIETVGFTLGDDALLADADKVFFCVADPATVVWIKRLRPDALDLYVLYNDLKPRYVTYMQMAEAMLHHVRLGQRVVCVFYGHPGVFVLATHRAILIARREGHLAIMRPGVCALDCLCADLGVDPCHPGMQTHEATDMLLRGRKPDTSLHVVLWQVGLIGEMGFRREGYVNRNFSVFIGYLQACYGDDYPVTHYIASRYPTIPPIIETYRLSELHEPCNHARVTGLSTFYLAPRDVATADPAMAERLGLLAPGQNLRQPTGPLREIGAYASRELAAFNDFASFRVPDDYHWQEETGASNFLLELRQDIGLQQLYARNPGQALRDQRFDNLTSEERRLLETRDLGALQVAAKGIHRRDQSNEALVRALLGDRRNSIALNRLLRSGSEPRTWLRDYVQARNLFLDESSLAQDIAHTHRHTLLPWTGVYAVPALEISIVVLGNPRGYGGRLFVNGIPVPAFTYRRGALEWSSDGVAGNGFFRFGMGLQGRKAFGQFWVGASVESDRNYIEAAEADPDRDHLAPHLATDWPGGHPPDGRYQLRQHRANGTRQLEFTLSGDIIHIGEMTTVVARKGPRSFAILADGVSGSLYFSADPLTSIPEFSGRLSLGGGAELPCLGRITVPLAVVRPAVTTIPEWLLNHLVRIIMPEGGGGPALLWQTWEKYSTTSRIVHNLAVNARQGRY